MKVTEEMVTQFLNASMPGKTLSDRNRDEARAGLRAVLSDHDWERAVAWLRRGYGDRLTDQECESIVRVLFDRAWAARGLTA